jgi:hypothetical protein
MEVCDDVPQTMTRDDPSSHPLCVGSGGAQEQLMRSAANLEDGSTKHPMLTPPIALAHESLGELLLECGEPGYALQAFETSLRRHPRRLTALYGAALTSELTGDRVKAQALSRQFVEAAERVASDSSELARAKTFLANGHIEP